MAETNRVVARCIDGNLLTGTTIDFNPSQAKFHVTPFEGGETVEVRTNTLKALFFVKDLSGRQSRAADRHGFEAPRNTNCQGKKIAVLFKDGELLCGYTLSYVPGKDGFFMFPADSNTNNLRVYVVAASASEIKTGIDAEKLAALVGSKRRADPVKI